MTTTGSGNGTTTCTTQHMVTNRGRAVTVSSRVRKARKPTISRGMFTRRKEQKRLRQLKQEHGRQGNLHAKQVAEEKLAEIQARLINDGDAITVSPETVERFTEDTLRKIQEIGEG